jgi:hypothetical protein
MTMKKICLLLACFASVPAFAGNALVCFNPATEARVAIQYGPNGLGPYQFNHQLVRALYTQVGHFIHSGIVGTVKQSGTEFSFAIQDPYIRMSLKTERRGMRLLYSDRLLGSLTANFYFNPGECEIY